MKQIFIFALSVCFTLQFSSCQRDQYMPESIVKNGSDGLYVLNSGNMNTNKTSLDYFDYEKELYTSYIYKKINPTVTLGLGDVGNDMIIYGGKLYIAITNSNRVEVINVHTAQSLAHIDVEGPRYLTSYAGKVYVSSFNGAVYGGDPQLGSVVEIDTTRLAVTHQLEVGYQPEELLATGGKLYVANSGGYAIKSPSGGEPIPNYQTTVSVLNIATLTKIKDITVGTNPFRLRLDNEGKIWSTSIGNYKNIPSDVRIIDPMTDTVIKTLDMTISDMAFTGDSLYYYAPGPVYHILNTKTYATILNNFTDSTVISKPSALAIDPDSRKIYIGNTAKDYVSLGSVFCLNKNGVLDWEHQSGVSPIKFTFEKINN